MYATGLPRLGNSFFAASSMAIAVPTGIVLFCWIATLASGRLQFRGPMLWIVAFFVLFVIGGLSGVMLASVPIDLQLTDSYFIPGHIHYVLVGGAVAPLIGALYFWFPKLTGRMLDERLGYAQWGLFLAGSFVTFGGMLLLGISGMTRRVYTYPHTMQWDTLNLVTSIGAWAIGLSFLLLIVNVIRALIRPMHASDNPWQASGLEWSVPSPPPVYNFALIPSVSSRTPLWTDGDLRPVVTGLRVDHREILVTTVVEAEPDMREPVPDPSLWPFIAAIVTSAVLIASIYTPQAIVWGALPMAAVLIAWLYPHKILAPTPEQVRAQRAAS
jgi:cytochrome c oxidase subunit 1